MQYRNSKYALATLRLTLTALAVVVAAFSVGSKLQVASNASAVGPQDTYAGQDFSPEGEEFTVSMPQPPRVTVGKRFFGDRQRDHKFRLYVAYVGDTLYMVESYEGDKPKDLGGMLVSGRRSISSHAAIELNGVKGTEFTHDIEGLAFKGRYFATKKHLYVVEAATRGNDNARMDQFLNSFRFDPGAPRSPIDATTPTNSSDDIVNIRTAPTKAIILAKLPASYTDEAREHQVRGTVVLQCVLRANGQVSDIEVRSGLPRGLSEQSIEATKAIVFVPAMKDGKAVSQRIVVEYNFQVF